MNSGLRKVVFFVLLVGLAFVAYKYMIKKANNELAEKKARVEKDLAKLAKLEQAAATAKDWGNQLEQLEEAIGFLESKLPPTSEIDKVLQDVTVIAQKQGLRSKRVLTLRKKDSGGYVEQPLKMELVGNFNAFYSFLLELEQLPRIMKIRSLELEKEIEGQIMADFIVSIFFQNETG